VQKKETLPPSNSSRSTRSEKKKKKKKQRRSGSKVQKKRKEESAVNNRRFQKKRRSAQKKEWVWGVSYPTYSKEGKEWRERHLIPQVALQRKKKKGKNREILSSPARGKILIFLKPTTGEKKA